MVVQYQACCLQSPKGEESVSHRHAVLLATGMFRGLFNSIYGVSFVFRAQYIGFYYRRIGGFFVKGGTGNNSTDNVRLISYLSKSGFNIERLWQKKWAWRFSLVGTLESSRDHQEATIWGLRSVAVARDESQRGGEVV